MSYLNNCWRHLITLWRSKWLFLFEIVTCCFSVVFFILVFKISSSEPIKLDLINLLEKVNFIPYFQNPFIKEDAKNIFPSSKYFFTKKEDIAEMNSLSSFDNYLFDSSTHHTTKAGIYVDELSETKMKVYLGYHASSPDFRIYLLEETLQAFIKHYSSYEKEYTNIKSYNSFDLGIRAEDFVDVAIQITSAFLLIFSYINFSGFILRIPLKERVDNAKHLLYLSGGDTIAYWTSMMTIDLLKFLLLTIINIAVILSVSSEVFYLFWLVLIFIIVNNIYIYVFSFFANTEESGMNMYLSVTFLTSYFLNVLNSLIIGDITDTSFSVNITSIFPGSHFAYSVMRIQYNTLLNKVGQKNESGKLLINSLIISIVQFIVLILLLYIFENNKISPAFCGREAYNNPNYMNRYVQEQIEKTKNTSNTVNAIDLQKTYKGCCKENVKAINHLYLGLEANEKFGLLGFNGGGKSTTFKALTKELEVDTGEIRVFDYDLKTQFMFVRNFIGYCPQSNAFLDLLTVEENMSFFVSSKNKKHIDILLKEFHLLKYKYTQAVNLSGGNKRKLNFAIAMVNKRRFLLLDEPSTGVDPEARRVMWKNINKLNSYKNTYNMILTTHSIEEAEILCDTIGWMKEGNFLKVRNPEKLKIENSDGYFLEFKVNCNELDVVEMDESIEINRETLDYLSSVVGFREHVLNCRESNSNQKKLVSDSLHYILKDISQNLSEVSILDLKINHIKMKIKFTEENQPILFNYLLELGVSFI